MRETRAVRQLRSADLFDQANEGMTVTAEQKNTHWNVLQDRHSVPKTKNTLPPTNMEVDNLLFVE